MRSGKHMEMRRATWGAVVGLPLIAVACGGTSDTTPTLTTTDTSSATSTTTLAAAPPIRPRPVTWVDLKAGDCLADAPPTDPAVVAVNVVSCAGPHRAETYLRAPIPVNEALADVAARQCAAGLQQYAGSAAAGTYATTYLIDSEQDRTSNNPLPSTVICLLEGADGKVLTGSAHR